MRIKNKNRIKKKDVLDDTV